MLVVNLKVIKIGFEDNDIELIIVNPNRIKNILQEKLNVFIVA